MPSTTTHDHPPSDLPPGVPSLPEVAVAAERSIVAAALKHAKLLGRCIAVSEALQKGQKSPDATEVLAQTKAICPGWATCVARVQQRP